MLKQVIEVPVLSEAVRRIGVPLSLVTKANGMIYVSGISGFKITGTGSLIPL